MIRSWVCAAAAIAAVIGVRGTATAQRPMSVGIAAGAAIPIDDLGQITGPGYELAAMVGLEATPRARLRTEAAYRRYAGTNGGADFQVLGLGADLLMYLTAPGMMRLYAAGGGEFSRSMFRRTGLPTENDIAARCGVGLNVARGKSLAFSEIRLHNIFSGSNQSDDSRRFVIISAGMMIR